MPNGMLKYFRVFMVINYQEGTVLSQVKLCRQICRHNTIQKK